MLLLVVITGLSVGVAIVMLLLLAMLLLQVIWTKCNAGISTLVVTVNISSGTFTVKILHNQLVKILVPL